MASATTCVPGVYSSSSACIDTPSSEVNTTVATTSAPRSTPDQGSLPFTGGDVIGLSIIGALAVAGGVIIFRANRAKKEATENASPS